MGLLSNLFGITRIDEKPNNSRANKPTTPAKEREAREQLAYLRHLKRDDPAAYNRFMDKKMGIPRDQQMPADPVDRLVNFAETADILRGIGLINNPKEDLADDDASSILKALAPILPALIAAWRGQAPPGQYYAPPVEGAPAQPTAISASQEAPLSIVSNYVISQLDGKQPAAAAEWLVGMQSSYPQMGQVISAFQAAPDDRILVLLDDLSTRNPDFRGMVAWLRQRPEWTIQTIQALRRLATEAPKVGHGL